MPSLLPAASSKPFALSDPQLGSPDTIYVSSSYTVDAGVTLDLAGSPGFKLKAPHDATVTLDIDGAVNVVGGDHGGAIGVAAAKSPNSEADVAIGPGGSLTVTDDLSPGYALGVQARTDRASVLNQGELHVSAAVGSAIGVFAATSAPASSVEVVNDANLEVQAGRLGVGILTSAVTCSVTNDGVVSVTAASAIGMEGFGLSTSVANNSSIVAIGTDAEGSAIGAWAINAEITNHGLIHAMSEGQAIGVQADALVNFSNDGEISADSDSALPTIGVLFNSSVGGVMTNGGLIRADAAMLSEDVYDPRFGAVSSDALFNSGHIVGRIMTGAGADSITNTGRIDGDIFLGDDGDVYVGDHGRLDGTIFGGAGDDVISAGRQNDVVYGGELHDGPSGGDDNLMGGAGDDQLFGGQGDDTLVGGAGADTLTGGVGHDVFVFARVEHSSPTAVDLITDLSDTDVIDLNVIDADTTTDGNQAFHLVSAFTGAAGELTISYDGGSNLTTIAGDIDGDGVADLTIHATSDESGFTNFVL